MQCLQPCITSRCLMDGVGGRRRGILKSKRRQMLIKGKFSLAWFTIYVFCLVLPGRMVTNTRFKISETVASLQVIFIVVVDEDTSMRINRRLCLMVSDSSAHYNTEPIQPVMRLSPGDCSYYISKPSYYGGTLLSIK